MNISKILQGWYAENKRDLPWRHTRDPYKIWLSEIILQQTRVHQGMRYYEAFLRRFPDLMSLAGAPEDEVMKVWEGLGYYSRARHLHQTAGLIVCRFRGSFPEDHESILSLKGIGPYTAAAIASFAFDAPLAVVDGNVYRFLSRLYGITHPYGSTQGNKKLKQLAGKILDRENPGIHNQAIMEFGALVCTPKKPACHDCPLCKSCYAYGRGQTNLLPVRKKPPPRAARFFHYLFIRDGNYTYVKKRNHGDIWAGLYELPLIESDREQPPGTVMMSAAWSLLTGEAKYSTDLVSEPFVHELTHRRIFARFYHLSGNFEHLLQVQHYRRVALDHFRELAFPRLIEKYLEKWQE